MAKKAKTEPAAKSVSSTTKLVAKPANKASIRPAVSTTTDIDARISVGMFLTLSGAILSAFGLSTRGNADMYAKSLGIDVNLWWGLTLLGFGILLLAFGRVGQSKMEKAAR